MSPRDAGKRQNLDGLLVTETEKVLADPVFRRSPVLSRLLKYLVDVTIMGSADSLSSFTVAVDGLGRPNSFDPTSDSSARVQMVRLRKALEGYYAQHGPAEECCIYLQPASFRVRMAALADAYPNLYGARVAAGGRALGNDISLAITPDKIASATVSNNDELIKLSKSPDPLWFKSGGIAATVFVGAALISVAAWFGWQHFTPDQRTPQTPVLELMPVEVAASVDLKRSAQIVSTTFTDDLPRFKLSRVRVIVEGEDLKRPDNSEHVYRLFSKLEKNALGTQSLFLRLNDVRTNTVFWSRELELPDDPLAVSKAITPLISEINGTFGAIATHESAIYRDWNSGGYACTLKYFRFVATREKDDEQRVSECENKPVEEEQIIATMLAVRALFALERSEAQSDLQSAARKGMTFARAAVAEDPNDGSANFAAARISYTLNDCVSARFYTQRALELNSKSPMITSTLAALSEICAYPDADKLLDQALAVQNSRYAKGRMLLVMAALAQNRPDKIQEIIASDLPEKTYNRINYYLTETLIAAAQGKRADAARNWKLFSQLGRLESKTPDEKIRSIIVNPIMRRKAIALLQQGGAFET